MRKGPLIGGIILLVLGVLMAIGGFASAAQGASVYNTYCTGVTRYFLPSQCANLASSNAGDEAVGFFGSVFFVAGLPLLIWGAVAKGKLKVQLQPMAFQQPYQQAQPVQYQPPVQFPQPAPYIQRPVNPPVPSYNVLPANPPAPAQGPALAQGMGSQAPRNFCTKCGAPIGPGMAFCGACGAAVSR